MGPPLRHEYAPKALALAESAVRSHKKENRAATILQSAQRGANTRRDVMEALKARENTQTSSAATASGSSMAGSALAAETARRKAAKEAALREAEELKRWKEEEARRKHAEEEERYAAAVRAAEEDRKNNGSRGQRLSAERSS